MLGAVTDGWYWVSVWRKQPIAVGWIRGDCCCLKEKSVLVQFLQRCSVPHPRLLFVREAMRLVESS